MTTGKLVIGLVTSGLAAALVGAVSCGGVSSSDVVNARAQATTASCNYFMMCNDIGPNLMYSTYSDCTTIVNSDWTMGWPTATCQGHIDQPALTVCLDAIGATTDCSGLSELIALSKCSSATVCSANVADGGAD